VPHVHFHIIPKYAEASGLGIMWKPGAIDHPAAAELAALVVHELRG